MSSRVTGVNRFLLTLLGLLLLVGAVLGLVLSYGGFGAGASGTPVLPSEVSTFPDGRGWFWWAVVAACVLVALLSLRWLLAQLRTERTSRLDLTTDDGDGHTVLHTGALASAVEHEASSLRGVTGASAHVRDEGGRRLMLAVDLTDYADIAAVRRELEDRTVPNARQALDDPGLPVDLELRPGRQRSSGRGLL